jgi:hypothetical protein
MTDIARGLDANARQCELLVVTAEQFSSLLRRADPAFVALLGDLRRDHHVCVALYVRPQHTAIEAAWKQFGWSDTRMTPTTYVAHESSVLHYFQILTRLREMLPGVEFMVRPFVPDLLHRGDIVADFVERVLELPDVAVDVTNRFNPSLPLEIANLLQSSPPGLFSGSNEALTRLKVLKDRLATWDLAPSDEIIRSRGILRQHCFREHEPDNLRLIEQLGWPVDHLVPPVDPLLEVDGDIEELDELWRPHASVAEAHLIFSMIGEAIANSHTTNLPLPPARWRRGASKLARGFSRHG